MITYFIVLILLNIFFLRFHKKISSTLNVYDKPDNVRKLHKKTTPITGGVLILGNLFFFYIYDLSNFLNEFKYENYFKDISDLIIFLISGFFIFLIGFCDDKYSVTPAKRSLLIILVLIPSIIYSDQLIINEIKLSFIDKFFTLNAGSFFWTILCFLLFINAFNMFDGINLQSTLYSIFLSSIFIVFNYYNIFFLTLIISLLIFLSLNIKSKSFLGDGGSYLLSFIFGYFYIKFYNQTSFLHADQIVLIMLIPGLDLMRLFIIRIFKKKNPFSADRNHLHHLLSKKFNFYVLTLIVHSLIIVPTIISFLFGYTAVAIISIVIIYSIIIYKRY